MKRTPVAHIFILIAFLVNTFGPMPMAQAQEFKLPAPGVMVHLSPPLNPPILKGIKVHPDNPFRFDFILDKGDSQSNNDQLKEESSKLIKYFLASLTIPEKDLWVNLSPYEKDRIVPESFGVTEMGRDLLAEDYMLKQITASLIYPEDEVGKKFWKRIYEEAQAKYHTTNIPVNTFNKVWIVPEKAVVYENAKAGTAYVVDSKLKVMLEQDYLSLEKHVGTTESATAKDTNQLGSQIVREVVIPELTKEINENKNFAQLRQVYNSLILATWYKKKIKDSILSQVYADKSKTAGVNIDNPQEKEKIYQQYLKAFKKGVYNYIKEDIDPITQQEIPRKYFSGGVQLAFNSAMNSTSFKTEQVFKTVNDPAMINLDGAALHNNFEVVEAGVNTATKTVTSNSQDKFTTTITTTGEKQFVQKQDLAPAHVMQFIANAKNDFQFKNSKIDRLINALGGRLDLKQAQNLVNIAILVEVGQLDERVLDLIYEFRNVKGMDNFLRDAQVGNPHKFENMMRQMNVAKKLMDDHGYIIKGVEADVGNKNVDIVARNPNKNNDSFFEVQLGDRLAGEKASIQTQEALQFLEKQIVEHQILVNQVSIGVNENGDLRASSELQQKKATVNLIFGPELTAKLNELQGLNNTELDDILRAFPQARLRLNVNASFELKQPDGALVEKINGQLKGMAGAVEDQLRQEKIDLGREFQFPGQIIDGMLKGHLSPQEVRKVLQDLKDADRLGEIKNEMAQLKGDERKDWVANKAKELMGEATMPLKTLNGNNLEPPNKGPLVANGGEFEFDDHNRFGANNNGKIPKAVLEAMNNHPVANVKAELVGRLEALRLKGIKVRESAQVRAADWARAALRNPLTIPDFVHQTVRFDPERGRNIRVNRVIQDQAAGRFDPARGVIALREGADQFVEFHEAAEMVMRIFKFRQYLKQQGVDINNSKQMIQHAQAQGIEVKNAQEALEKLMAKFFFENPDLAKALHNRVERLENRLRQRARELEDERDKKRANVVVMPTQSSTPEQVRTNLETVVAEAVDTMGRMPVLSQLENSNLKADNEIKQIDLKKFEVTEVMQEFLIEEALSELHFIPNQDEEPMVLASLRIFKEVDSGELRWMDPRARRIDQNLQKLIEKFGIEVQAVPNEEWDNMDIFSMDVGGKKVSVQISVEGIFGNDNGEAAARAAGANKILLPEIMAEGRKRRDKIIAHEIGHNLDFRFGLREILAQEPDEVIAAVMELGEGRLRSGASVRDSEGKLRVNEFRQVLLTEDFAGKEIVAEAFANAWGNPNRNGIGEQFFKDMIPEAFEGRAVEQSIKGTLSEPSLEHVSAPAHFGADIGDGDYETGKKTTEDRAMKVSTANINESIRSFIKGMIQKLKILNQKSPFQREIHLHGTNMMALEGMLKAGGVVLPLSELEKKGIVVTSGESQGLTDLNQQVVSTVILGGQIDTAVRYANWASGRKKVVDIGGAHTLGVSPSNIDDEIRVAKKALEKSLDFEKYRRKEYLKKLERLKKYFDGLANEEKTVINDFTRVPIVAVGYDSGEQRVNLSHMAGGIGGGERAVQQLTVNIIATTEDDILKVSKLLKKYGREDIKVVSLDDLFSIRTDLLKAEGKLAEAQLADREEAFDVNSIGQMIRKKELQLMESGIDNIKLFALRTVAQQFYRTDLLNPFGANPSYGDKLFMVGINPKKFVADTAWKRWGLMPRELNPQQRNQLKQEFLERLYNTFITRLNFGDNDVTGENALARSPVFEVFRGFVLPSENQEGESELTKVDFSTPEKALAVAPTKGYRDWYSQASVPVSSVKDENEVFSTKLSAEDLSRIKTEIDRYLDQEVMPYLRAHNLLHGEEQRAYYHNVILRRQIPYFLYARFLTWLVEGVKKTENKIVGVIHEVRNQTDSWRQENWIGDKLREKLIGLNNGKPIKDVIVMGNFEKNFGELNAKLASLDDNEYVYLVLANDMNKSSGENRIDYRIVIDKAGHIKQNIHQLWMGDIKLGGFEYLIDYSVYPINKRVHLHNIALDRDFQLSKGGLTSETFAKTVAMWRNWYSGFDITTVAISANPASSKSVDPISHWFVKYFNAKFLMPNEIEKNGITEYIDPPDLNKVMKGKIGGADNASIAIEGKKGGIDLTPANMNLQTQNSGGEIKFHLDPAMLQQLQNAPGFVPVIINIKPLENLRIFLCAQ